MMTTYAIDIRATTGVDVLRGVATTYTDRTPTRAQQVVPVLVAGDQAYYWTARWQADERESVQALKRGEGQTFESAADLVAWLNNGSE